MKLVHNVIASDDEIRAAWKAIFEFPIETSDGNVFQFDLDSQRLMAGALKGWDAAGLTTIDWRLNDNSEVTCSKSELQAYYDELEVKKSVRGFQVDVEYKQFKLNKPSPTALEAWKQSYL